MRNITEVPRAVIVDGPDGAGKSTLCDDIKAWYENHVEGLESIRIHHHGPYKGERRIAHHYAVPLLQLVKRDRSVVIFDRSWLSEFVYDKVYKRGGPRVSLAEARMLHRVVLALGGTYIWAQPALTTCVANRPNQPRREIIDAGKLFGLVFKRFAPRAVVYDYQDYLGYPIEFIDRQCGYAAQPNPGPGAGSFRKGVTLLVGDRPNSAKHGDVKHRLPFVSFGPRVGCSAWLADQLNAAGAFEDDLYWVNAYDADGVETDHSFISKLQPARVVLLGSEAERWFDQAATLEELLKYEPPPHLLKVDHPQFHKRFKANQPYPLVGILRSKKP